MAEIPSSSEYWCYHCDKRVSIETLTDLPDIICFECKNGFVESIPQASPSPPPPPPPPPPPSITNQQPYFSNHFLQILRLIAESAHDDDDDNPPPSPPPAPAPADSNDFLRIQLDGWNNDRDDDDDDDEDEINPLEIEEEQDVDSRRRRHDLLRLRIRDFAYRNPNRLMDWSDILMGLQSHTMEFRFQMPEYYVGNPEDYVDAAGYEALLQRLADTDGGTRGPPPASKSAVSALKTVLITNLDQEGVACCAICKETLALGEEAKKLPCGHGYHGHCILTWLGSRNTCPVCRFQLPTEDPDYEDQRSSMGPSSSHAHAGSSTSGPNNPTSP